MAAATDTASAPGAHVGLRTRPLSLISVELPAEREELAELAARLLEHVEMLYLLRQGMHEAGEQAIAGALAIASRDYERNARALAGFINGGGLKVVTGPDDREDVEEAAAEDPPAAAEAPIAAETSDPAARVYTRMKVHMDLADAEPNVRLKEMHLAEADAAYRELVRTPARSEAGLAAKVQALRLQLRDGSMPNPDDWELIASLEADATRPGS